MLVSAVQRIGALGLFAGDLVPLSFEHGGDAIFAYEVPGSDSYECDSVTFEKILDLGGEVLVALDHEDLEEVGIFVPEFGVVERVELCNVT